MTALAGLWRFAAEGDGVGEACARMLRAQEIYGRDGSGHRADGPVALGRNLARLLPEDRFDRQPLSGGGGGLLLVADLRLDNRAELAAELGLRESVRAADAAILLAAWERWGEACLPRLVGPFALAVWERAAARLVLARDFAGQRPLYLHRGADFVAFASMAKGLHALPEVPYAADEAGMEDFLALTPDRGGFFAGVTRLRPGEVTTVTREGVRARRFWDPSLAPLRLGREGRPQTDAAYVEAFRDHLDRAVARCLRGSDHVASHLSSGFDSGAVTATAARLLAPRGGRVTAFTAAPREGYDGKAPRGRILDEAPLAAETAALHPNVAHVVLRPDGRSPLADLDRYFYAFERPLLNLCNALWLADINVAAQARGLNVLLTGAMGNMTISYDGREGLHRFLVRGRWWRWWRTARVLVKGGHARWHGVLAHSLGPWCPPRLWEWLWRMARGERLGLSHVTALHPDKIPALRARADELDMDFSYRPWADGAAMRLWAIGRVDPGNYLKGCWAAWGVDLRDPTIDRDLLEFCLRVPAEQYLSEAMPRALPRRALADRLPAAVLERRDKGLQAADWHEALTGDRAGVAAELARLRACPEAARLIDLDRLDQLVRDWPQGDWERDAVMAPYRLALLRGLSAGHFLRRTQGGNA